MGISSRFRFAQQGDSKKSYYDQDGVASGSSSTSAGEIVSAPKGTFVTVEDDVSSTASSARDFYKPLETYEGFHRYDPEFQWEDKEEQRLIRTLDYRICAYVCLMFFALQLDRGNISQAVSDNMLPDLGLNQNDYNTGQTIFYLTFLAAELPSQMISKRIGPDNWIPVQMISWSLVASMQAFLSGKSSFFACRALLGLIEGGFIPDTVLYLTYFYKSKELPTRLSFFWTSYQLTYVISAFLAYGILHMRGINGLAGWRWLFALEGTITGIIGIVTYFYLPPSPTQTASRFRGKNGWFNEREEKILVNRILRDDPSKGDMHNRQAVDWSMFRKCLSDYDMWPTYFIGFSWMLVQIPVQQYLTLELRQLGFDTFETNLLSIPAYVLFIINLLFWTWVSKKTGSNFITCLISQAWCLPCLIALVVLPDNASKWARYACTSLIVGYPYVHAIIVASTCRNAGSVRTRTVASALYNMTVQASNIIGSNIYRDSDKPYYRTGNKALLGILAWNVIAFIGCRYYYAWKNQSRDRKWNAMTGKEKVEYLTTTKDEGNKRLDFRFEY